MTTKERFDKYVKENCSRCRNKNKYDCEIKVMQQGNITVTKCDCYERED